MLSAKCNNFLCFLCQLTGKYNQGFDYQMLEILKQGSKLFSLARGVLFPTLMAMTTL